MKKLFSLGGFAEKAACAVVAELGEGVFLELADAFLGKPDDRRDFLQVDVGIRLETIVKFHNLLFLAGKVVFENLGKHVGAVALLGGFFGAVSKRDVCEDVFFGVDYHSHLGTKTGGVASYDPEIGLQREIHNISNSPFRTKFEHIFDTMKGCSAIGCVNDTDPQPLLMRSKLGKFAIYMVGIINNSEELINNKLSA